MTSPLPDEILNQKTGEVGQFNEAEWNEIVTIINKNTISQSLLALIMEERREAH